MVGALLEMTLWTGDDKERLGNVYVGNVNITLTKTIFLTSGEVKFGCISTGMGRLSLRII